MGTEGWVRKGSEGSYRFWALLRSCTQLSTISCCLQLRLWAAWGLLWQRRPTSLSRDCGGSRVRGRAGEAGFTQGSTDYRRPLQE